PLAPRAAPRRRGRRAGLPPRGHPAPSTPPAAPPPPPPPPAPPPPSDKPPPPPSHAAAEATQGVERRLLPIGADGQVRLDADLEGRAEGVGATPGRAEALVDGVEELPRRRVEPRDVHQCRIGLQGQTPAVRAVHAVQQLVDAAQQVDGRHRYRETPLETEDGRPIIDLQIERGLPRS